MRKYACALVLGLAFFAGQDRGFAAGPGIEFDLQGGYREDELNWNIAGNSAGTSPNVLSELSWTDIKIIQVRSKLTGREGFLYFRGMADYGWIYDGENQDSDYLGDNRTLEISRSNNKADNGNVYDLSAGLGFRFEKKFKGGSFEVSPLAGYSYNKQDLRMTDGNQTICVAPDCAVPLGPFSGLDSTYEARWMGPWAGVDAILEFGKFSIFGSFEYHFSTDYHAEADWNLRSDFQHPVSFEHDADGHGIVGSIGAGYAFTDRWIVTATFSAQDWEAEDGTDKTFFTDGTTAETKLNEVNWESFDMMLGLKYMF